MTNLVLARSTERARDLAVRAALGASRGSLVRQTLIECLVLASGGGVLGIAIAWAGLRPILALLPASSRVPRLDGVGMDFGVLLFALGVTFLTTMLSGLLPAWRASRVDLQDALRDGGRSQAGSVGARRFGNVLIVGEMALAFVLVMGAGLLLRSFMTLIRTDPGFNPDHVLAISLTVPSHRYGTYDLGGPNPARARLFEEIERRITALPGVRSASVTTSLPLRHGPNPWSLHIDGLPPPASGTTRKTATRNARQGLTHQGDVLHAVDREVYPNVFWPMAQLPGSSGWVAVRTHADPAGMAPAIEQESRRIDADLAITEVTTMNTVLGDSLWRPRLAASLLGSFGALAALLAAAGIYAVFSYAVNRRVQEIGLRIALGARPPQVLRLIIGSALNLAIAGLVLGLACTWLMGGVIAGYLHGVPPYDVATIVVAAGLMLVVATLASWWPARRASKVDPLIALREA